LEGKDALAILPTGGGKSICYQVPTMIKDGICIVISPLIALMKDQVESLVSKGIPAIAVYSGMSKTEIDIALDNCIYGNIKFLYLSPERLASELAIMRISKMNVNLLAVDEAHCISQWGYDFRPPYLRIAEIREHLPKTSVLALTATATPKVREDIQEKLLFKKKLVFQQSFARENLAYIGIKEENKLQRILNILNKVPGSGLIYARNRRMTKEIAEFLQRNNISADYYHAGLDTKTRSIKQDNWKSGKTRIMAATNAFGMGIDKANVRTVIHFDIPNSLEAYYQEAGRAGRDGIKSFAVFIFNYNDRMTLEKLAEISFPDLLEIKRTYQAMSNYLQVASGAGEGVTYDYDIGEFCNTYNLNPTIAFNCLRILELEGLISLSDAIYNPSRVKILMHTRDLYDFQVKNKKYDEFIKLLLRSYDGMFDNYTVIREEDLAIRFEKSNENITTLLHQLNNMQVINYLPRNDSPKVTFLEARMNVEELSISREHLIERKKRYYEKMNAALNFVENTSQCRSILLLSYFGENTSYRCGICDFCLKRNKLDLNDMEFGTTEDEILHLLKDQPMKLDQLISQIKTVHEDKALKVIDWMLENEKIKHVTGNLIDRY
jgi:ATP-dependent DNA helicase RecQ